LPLLFTEFSPEELPIRIFPLSNCLKVGVETVIVKLFETTVVPEPSVTLILIAELPAVVAVPEMIPVAPSRVSPAGKVPVSSAKVLVPVPEVDVTVRL